MTVRENHEAGGRCISTSPKLLPRSFSEAAEVCWLRADSDPASLPHRMTEPGSKIRKEVAEHHDQF